MTDEGLEDSSREDIAKAIHSTPREPVRSGKPVFPTLPSDVSHVREHLGSLVGSASWLIFDLIHLEGPNDWLQTPATMWDLFSEYRKLKTVVHNLPVTNDLAERGIHLVSEFISRCSNEDERQDLFQCVEYHRKLVTDCSKKNLALC